MSRSLRGELKGSGVRVAWLLQLLSGFSECRSCHWECLQSKRCGVLNVTQINDGFGSTWNLFDG